MTNIPILNKKLPRRYAIGLDLGGTNLKYGIVSDQKETVYKNLTAAGTDKGAENILRVMTESAKECLMFAKKENFQIEAIGAGCPGTIDAERGIALAPTSHIPDWEGVTINKTLSQATSLPSFADNDANLMAYGEYVAGAARGYRYMVGITLGTGIGGGIIIDGEIYHGAIFNGAELGHVVVETDGRICPCGNRGCVEKYVGAKSIVNDVLEALGKRQVSIIPKLVNSFDEITPKIIFQAALQGDELGKSIVNQMVKYLGAGLASIVHVLSPEILVIGGGISDAGDMFIERVRAEVLGRVMRPIKNHLKIVRAQLGNDAGLMGCASWALKQTTKN